MDHLTLDAFTRSQSTSRRLDASIAAATAGRRGDAGEHEMNTDKGGSVGSKWGLRLCPWRPSCFFLAAPPNRSVWAP